MMTGIDSAMSSYLAKLTVVLVLAGLPLAACGKKEQPPAPPPPRVGYVVVAEQAVTLTSELPGRTTAYETSEVRPQVAGLITARLFEEGNQVRKGQALYRIDPGPYQAQVASARAALTRAQASTASTRALSRRYGELVKINAISRQAYEDALTGANQAQADVTAQRAAVRTAQIDIGRTTVTAPISGRIGASVATTGALVSAGQAAALTTIQRLDPVFVDIQQSSADLLRLRQQMLAGQVSRGGGDARVRLKLEDGTTYPQEGTLKFAAVTVDATTGSQTIRAVFPNRQGLLLPGMFVRAELVEGTQRSGMLVPQRAVSRDERGRATVLVVGQGSKAEPRTLTTSRTVGDNWLVTGGLKPGDKVIVEGAMLLRPGAVVNAQPASGKPAAPGQSGAPAQAQAK
jgi:membrane fusion protein (multidrug efflux system)